MSHVPSYSKTGVHKARTAYNRCYRQSRIGDKNLRGCLAEAHGGLSRAYSPGTSSRLSVAARWRSGMIS